MLFLSRIVTVAGALMASVRQTSRPDPGGFSALVHGSSHRTLRTSVQVKALPLVPTLKVGPSSRVARLVRSKALACWGKSSMKQPAPVNSPAVITPVFRPTLHSSPQAGYSYPNLTIIAPVTEMAFGPARYVGPKDLAVIEDRRALIVYKPHGSCALGVYSRPSSLSLYTGPLNYIQFWVDARNYELVAFVYRPRFQEGSSLFKEYTHLDSTSFERWECQAAENFDLMLAGDRSVLREMFGLVSSKYITIGDFKRGPEEWASRALGHLYALGFLVSLTFMTLEECTELQQALAKTRLVAPSAQSDSAALRHIESQIPLALGNMAEETVPCSPEEWWNDRKKSGMGEVDVMTTHFDTSISHSTLSIEPIAPTTTPTEPTPTAAPVSRRVAKMMALAQRPGGPRFKSAAWKRCKK